jgi:hypothetical protein
MIPRLLVTPSNAVWKVSREPKTENIRKNTKTIVFKTDASNSTCPERRNALKL